jgi:hypothetical protein
MALTVWWRRLVSAVRRSVRSGPRARRRNNSRPRQRPALERLEDRTLLTITAISSADPTMLSDTAAGNLQGPASVSSDGRYVVYTSTAANLAPNQVMPSESSANVFLYDRANGTTTLVSHAFSSATTAADGTSKNAVISANGNWIAYVSNSDNLVSGETLADDTYSLVVQGYTGGTFALAYGAQTVNIAYNATASTVASDLAGLAGGAGNVSVTGGNGEPFTITFTGALANGASSPLTADGSGLTGGGGSGNFVFLGGHNEFLCDQYWAFLYNVQTGATTLVSHVASDQGTGYQTTVSEGTSGILTGAEGGLTSLASQTTSVSISSDGSSVVYLSTGVHLVAGEVPTPVNVTNPPLGTPANVFVYDRTSDTNYLVSREDGSPTNSAGAPTTPGDNTSYVAVIDQNGDTIAFTNQSVDLVHGQTINSNYGDIQGETPQFFVAKRSGSTWASATMALASHDLTGATDESITNTTGPLDYPAPVLTPDGHWMVYMTDNAIVQSPITGTNAGMGDNYYLYDTTQPNSVSNNTLITRTPGNATQVGNAGPDTFVTTTAPSAAVSDNGQYVAFYSAATDLLSTATQAGYNAFLFNASTGAVVPITNRSIPTSSFPVTTYPPLTVSISGDGRYVAYVGFATADIGGLTDDNALPGTMGMDALLYDQGPNPGSSTPTYTLLSHEYTATKATGNGEAYTPVISEDGSTVLYLDDSTNLINPTPSGSNYNGKDLNAALPTDGTDLYAYSLNTPTGYTPLAANGTNALVTLRDPNLPTLTANGLSEISPIDAVSNDGKFTVFVSDAPNLVAGEVDTNLSQNVYLYNNTTGAVTLLSHAAGSDTTTADGESANAVISSDGKTVLFYSYATDLGLGGSSTANETFAGAAGQDVELYLYDNNPSSPTYGQLILVSHTPGNPTQAANGTLPGTPNGQVVGYSSLLYSSPATAQGLALPSLSSDGQYIAYLSSATDLSGSNTGLSGAVSSASDPLLSPIVITSTNHGLVSGDQVTITGNSVADGTWTITVTDANHFSLDGSLGTGGSAVSGGTWTANVIDAFLYDRGTGGNTMISQAGGGTTANGNTDTVALSADGSTVAFTSLATDLAGSPSFPGNSNQGEQLYVWTRIAAHGLSAGQTVLASHAFGSSTTAASFRSYTDPSTGLTTTTGTSAWGPLPASLSSDGAFVAYYFGGSNLVNATADPNAAATNVFRYDVANNANTLVSHANSSATTAGDNPTNANLYEGSGPAISANGEFIAYANNSTDLLSTALTGQNGQDNVYLYDANQSNPALQNTLVSHKDGSATMPDTGGGTAPSITSNGRYVSFIDLALDTTADVSCTFTGPGAVRIYDAQAPATTQPKFEGLAYDRSSMLLVGATLASTELSGDGSTLVWNGPSAGNVSQDLNGNIDVFIEATVQAPTKITINYTSSVPLSNDTPLGTTVGTLTAIPTNQTYTYSFGTLNGVPNDNTLFSLTSTGTLTTATTFSVQTVTTYNITVTATNVANPNLSLTQSIPILVYPPITSLNVSLTTPPPTISSPGQTSVATLTTTDPNSQTGFTYALVNIPNVTNNNNLFTVNQTTGLVQTLNPITTAGTYTISVQVTDSVGLIKQTTFTINVYQPITSFSLNLTSPPPLTSSPALTSVGLLTTVDPNLNQTFTYALVTIPGVTNNNSLFTLSQTTNGLVQTLNPITTPGTYTISVQVTDSVGLYVQNSFTVTVYQPITNVGLSNSTVPTYQPTGTIVGQLTSTDPNLTTGQTVTYTLVSNADNNSLFSIDSHGNLRTDRSSLTFFRQFIV